MSECSLQIFDCSPNKKVVNLGFDVPFGNSLRKMHVNLQIKIKGKIEDSFSITRGPLSAIGSGIRASKCSIRKERG